MHVFNIIYADNYMMCAMQEQDVRFYPILEAAQLSLRHRMTWQLKGGLKDSGSLKNGQLRPAHMLDTATLGASICPWRALCPAMRYMRLAIAQCLVYMCPDDVGASDEERAASAIGTLRLAPNDINCLLDNLSLSEFQGMCGDISVYSSIAIRCDAFTGVQTIRCYPFGAAYQFHSKNIQDTVFAIPARIDRDSFDISNPMHEKELVFGRLYCIFRISIFDMDNSESESDIDMKTKERELVLIKASCFYIIHPGLYIVLHHLVHVNFNKKIHIFM